MAILVVSRPVLTTSGTTVTMATAAAGGDSFANTGVEYVQVVNAHATLPRTVTFDSPNTCDLGLAAHAQHDLAVVVPAVTRVTIGPFPRTRFNDGNDRVQISYSDSAADLTILVQGAGA